MRLRITDRYRRSERRLPSRLRARAHRALITFLEDPGRPGLNFERLSSWDNMYSIRVNVDYRILLMREIDEVGELFAAVDVGTHKIYRR